jgi:hypothetical protein
MRKKYTYDDYIIKSVLANNEFGISKVSHLADISTINLVSTDYGKIVDLIRNKEFEKIKTFQSSEIKTAEYITISKFNDQNNKNYIVTSYDSDLLEQDPQVIDIFEI